jgi:hypothetical protein
MPSFICVKNKGKKGCLRLTALFLHLAVSHAGRRLHVTSKPLASPLPFTFRPLFLLLLFLPFLCIFSYFPTWTKVHLDSPLAYNFGETGFKLCILIRLLHQASGASLCMVIRYFAMTLCNCFCCANWAPGEHFSSFSIVFWGTSSIFSFQECIARLMC